MGILDVFIDIPRNIGNIMCCSARIDRDETTPKHANAQHHKALVRGHTGLAPESPTKTPPNQMCGVGIVFQDKHKDGLYVSSLVKGGPAFMSHAISTGDVLLEIDNVDVASDPLSSLGPRLLGAPGSLVKLKFKRGGESTHVVELTRAMQVQITSSENLSSSVDGKLRSGNPADLKKKKKKKANSPMAGRDDVSIASTD